MRQQRFAPTNANLYVVTLGTNFDGILLKLIHLKSYFFIERNEDVSVGIAMVLPDVAIICHYSITMTS